jgi:MFS family permease
MIGFGVGGVLMGRLADRFGVMWPLLLGAAGLGAGYVATGLAGSIVVFSLAQGCWSGCWAARPASRRWWPTRRCGSSPARHRGGGLHERQLHGRRAVAADHVQHFIETVGWRQTYIGMGIFCGLAMAALALCLRERPPGSGAGPARNSAWPARHARPFGLGMGNGARAAVRGRRGLLRGDGDAAGAHRGLLRRPRFRRRARRRDAVADAGASAW